MKKTEDKKSRSTVPLRKYLPGDYYIPRHEGDIADIGIYRCCRISEGGAEYLQVLQNIGRCCRISAVDGLLSVQVVRYIPPVRPPRQGRAGTVNVARGRVAPL
jgi:hypothetical protein